MQQIMTAQGRHLPAPARSRAAVDELQALLVRSRESACAPAPRRQSRARHGLPHAEDAEARAVRRLRRARRAPRAAARISARTIRAATTPSGSSARSPPGRTRRHAADARLRAARREAMELPPGWRGYGAKDYVDHPDTPQRQAESRRDQGEAGRRGPVRRAGGADALRAPAARHASAAATNASTSRCAPAEREPRPTTHGPATTDTPRARKLTSPDPALQPAGARQRPAHADLRARREPTA